MRRKGFRILPAVKGPGSIEDGVAFLQSYEIVVHPRCALLAGELGRYSWRTDPMTGEVLPMLEDKDNNAIDALRYALEGLRRAPKSRAASRPTAGKTAYRKQRAAKASGWAA
jgi:phage terminase large subunit